MLLRQSPRLSAQSAFRLRLLTKTMASEAPLLLPKFTRARELAKLLGKDKQLLLKRVCFRADRRFHVLHPPTGATLSFNSAKEVIFDFAMARAAAEALGCARELQCVPLTGALGAQQFNVLATLEGLEGGKNRKDKNKKMKDSNTRKKKRGNVEVAAHSAGIANGTAANIVVVTLGHVDHGKSTLLAALAGLSTGSDENDTDAVTSALHEHGGITQAVDAWRIPLSARQHATFLDTPGHYHFFRMREGTATAAGVALLVVCVKEGVQLQTQESIGIVEQLGMPVVVVLNKADVLDGAGCGDLRVAALQKELRSFTALERARFVTVSARRRTGLCKLRGALLEVWHEGGGGAAAVQTEGDTEAVAAVAQVLEVSAVKGRGQVLKVLVGDGVLRPGAHFVCGMTAGTVRQLLDTSPVRAAPLQCGDSTDGECAGSYEGRQLTGLHSNAVSPLFFAQQSHKERRHARRQRATAQTSSVGVDAADRGHTAAAAIAQDLPLASVGEAADVVFRPLPSAHKDAPLGQTLRVVPSAHNALAILEQRALEIELGLALEAAGVDMWDRLQEEEKVEEVTSAEVDVGQREVCATIGETENSRGTGVTLWCNAPVPLVLKACSAGSLAAILDAIEESETLSVAVHVVRMGLGDVSAHDVNVAAAGGVQGGAPRGVVLGCQVRVSDAVARRAAKLSVRTFSDMLVHRLLEKIEAMAEEAITKSGGSTYQKQH